MSGYEAGRKAAPTEVVTAEPYSVPNAQPERSSYQPSRQLEAEPIHAYPTQETSRVSVQPSMVETAPAAQTLEAPAAARPAETAAAPMDRRELMRIAKAIKIEGIRLKDVFNAKRIDEAGLRAVVEVYLQGGDVRQRLTQEVINKEKSFEIDPLNRGRRNDDQPTGGGSLSRAADKAREQGSRLAESSKSTAQKAGKALAGAQQELIENTDSITWLSVTAVVIIWSLIAFLVFG